ncbi:MAG: DUF6279 family lipoprotein [Pseudomonadales bacterium]
MSAVRGWLLPLLLVCASGCSVPLAYNNLDRLARWSMSDYISMDPAQRSYFDAAFHDVWTWHRREHLPLYAAWLGGLSESLVSGTTEAEMQSLVDQVVAWANDIAARGTPLAADLLASLSDDQVEQFARALEDGNREFAEPELGLSVAEAQQAWQKEVADRFSRFSGRLNGAQQDYLRSQSVRYIPDRVLWADYRRRWQRDLLALLRHRHEPQSFLRGFEQLAANRSSYYGSELAPIMASNQQLTREVSVWLINSLTDRQRQRFAGRLEGLAEDFANLADARGRAQPVAAPACLVIC